MPLILALRRQRQRHAISELHSKFQNSMGCRKILSLGVRESMRGAGEKGKEKEKKCIKRQLLLGRNRWVMC